MFRSIHTKIVVAFAAVFLITASIILSTSYVQIKQHEQELSDSMGLAAAQECANAIEIAYDQGSGGEFVPGSSNYDSCCRYLRDLCLATGMNYLYVYKYDTENNTITYIMAVGASDDENEMINRERPYGKVVHTKISDAEIRSLAGEDVKSPIETNDQLGFMFDWVSPVRGMGNDVLAGASYSVTKQRQEEMANVWNSLLPFAIVFLVLFIVEILILRKSVFDPLTVIAQRMRGFRADRMDELGPLGITSNDEIGDIAEAFEGMAADIGDYVSDIERMASERAQAAYELDVSRRIQQGMVPERTEKVGTRYTACGFSRAAHSVGGDYYDVTELEDGRVTLIVGDVAGKGLSAALFMTMAKTVMHESVQAGLSPAEVLNHVNARLLQSNPEGMFVTSFVCIIDPANGEAHFANAGHMPPLLIGDGVRALEIETGELLGLFDDPAFEEGSIVLERDQSLLIYTDGVVEARGGNGSFLGERRFAEELRAALPCMSAGGLVDAVVHIVDVFAADSEQFDDLTVAAFMLDGASEPVPAGASGLSDAIALPRDSTAFSKVREALFATSVDDNLKRKACLACEEAFVNIVSYSCATQIWAQVRENDGQLCIELADDGIPFDPLAASPDHKDFEDLDSGGMGIGLICQLATKLEYRYQDDRNVLTIIVS